MSNTIIHKQTVRQTAAITETLKKYTMKVIHEAIIGDTKNIRSIK